jgi:hypothetical protein
MEIRGMIEEEDKYSYTQSNQISSQCGLIGYLRGDLNGGFWTTWFDFRKDLKTDEFKEDLNDLINELIEEEEILTNLKSMREFCYLHPRAQINENWWGIRADTEKYTYMIRLGPATGDYNFYIYCYKRDWLTDHIKQARRGIKFIEPDYKEKFRIADGDQIRIKLEDGTNMDYTCRYVDDYHMEVGSRLYHICEFAEEFPEVEKV